METCNKQKIVANYACFCSATLLTSKIIIKIIKKNILNFLGVRMAAINLFQVGFSKVYKFIWLIT